MNTYSEFSFNFASVFLQNKATETACVSPVSLLLPLAAVASASERKTKAEFARVLGETVIDPPKLLADMHELCNGLNDCPSIDELTNTIVGEKNHEFLPIFINNMRNTFSNNVGMQPGKGDNITLTNIIHFKEDWATHFSESEERFYSTPYGIERDGQSVPFLYYDEERLGYTKNSHCQSVTIPFKTAQKAPGFSGLQAFSSAAKPSCYMTFAMPLDCSIDDILVRPEQIAKMLRCEIDGYQNVEVHLPAFKLEQEKVLNDDLKQLGLQSAFNEYVADFPNMAELKDDERLYIKEAKQEIMVNVNATGAEARAKTQIKMSFVTIGSTIPYVQCRKEILRFNHPFLFTIWIRTSNNDMVPLFIGAKR